MRYHFIILLLVFGAFYGCNKGDKEMPPPEIYIQMPEGGYEIEPDSALLISPKITYDYDTHYIWKLNGEVIDHNEKDLVYTSNVLKTDTFEFFVYSDHGSDSIIIPVQTLILVDFEEFPLDKYTTHINKSETGYFSTKGLSLPVKNISTENYWSGFAISLETNTTTQSIENQFSVYAKSGADGSKKFSVFLSDEKGSPNRMYFTDGNDHHLKSISVNNTTYTALTIRRGDTNAKAFDYGDWYKLTIKGYDKEDNPTGEVEFYLADYRQDENYKIISTWSKVDLHDLGKVNSVEFILTSTDTNEDGYNTPLYFCLDNIKIID